MKDFTSITNPVFHFKGYYVRILVALPWNVYLSLRALCASYTTCTSIADLLGRFVRFVAVELCYPLQVFPVNNDDK